MGVDDTEEADLTGGGRAFCGVAAALKPMRSAVGGVGGFALAGPAG